MVVNRRVYLRLKRKSSIYLQLVITFVICAFVFDKLIIQKRYFRRKTVNSQTDLLDYNEDAFRSGWPFQITKHYDMDDLKTYTPKQKIIARSDAPGERGSPVVLSPVLQDLADISFSEYELNIVSSDRVPYNRSLPDFRHPKCLSISYPTLLPSTSVIMVVHNEAWSILMRAIWSVLIRTPDELLEELIIVDDLSDKSHLKEHLEEYMATHLPAKVKLIRTTKREGLIRARLVGAEAAKGQVLAFLDGNTESNDGWLEPLLSRIASDRSVIAVPHVDNINFTNMAYEHFDEGIMYGLGWNLYYKTFPIPEREWKRNKGDPSAPYRTPALIGCAIIIDREFFYEIGTFDMDMNIWGGENTELSLRVWQCGGAMEIVPCSRMGHYFRTLPYSFNGDKQEVKIINNMRTAEVWMDEYKPYFDVVTAAHLKKLKAGDISKRLSLRNRLKCKGFRWYLKNVFPESIMLIGYKVLGQIQQFGSMYCLDKLGRNENRQIGIHSCHGNGYTQGFSYQKNDQIVFHHSLCLSLAVKENITKNITDPKELNDPNVLTPEMDTTNHVVLLNCSPTNGTKWRYDEKKHQIMHQESGLCLSRVSWMAIIAPCDLQDSKQRWHILTFEEYTQNLSHNLNPIDRSNP